MGPIVNIVLAGFGGQGVLFAGKVIAYCRPHRGPRGLVAALLRPRNARRHRQLQRVTLSDEPIGSPAGGGARTCSSP